MNRYLCLMFLSCLFVSASFARNSVEYKFPIFSKVAGVQKVDFQKPYLWVVVNQHADQAAIEVELKRIAQSDPDALALEGQYNLHVRDVGTYRDEKNMYSTIRRANSVWGMRELYKGAYTATIYDLDWSTEAVLHERRSYTSKPYRIKDSGQMAIEKMNKEVARVNSLVEVYRSRENRPGKVISFHTFEFGDIVYPVFGDDIMVRNDTVSFSDFAKVFGKE